MAENKILYHGSAKIVKIPIVLTRGYNNDFGDAFYLTEIKRHC